MPRNATGGRKGPAVVMSVILVVMVLSFVVTIQTILLSYRLDDSMLTEQAVIWHDLLWNFTTFTTFSRQTYGANTLDRTWVLSNVSSPTTTEFLCPLHPCHVSMVLIGDSLTRFLYFTLAYYWHHNNTWIDPKANPNLAIPRTFFFHNPSRGRGENLERLYDWTPWFEASQGALRPYETCDCYRPIGSTTKYPGSAVLCENRYYHNPRRNITLVFFQARGHVLPLRGHWPDSTTAFAVTPSYLLKHENKHVGLGGTWKDTAPQPGPHPKNYPFAWSYLDWSEAVTNQVLTLQPQVLILNAGKFRHQFLKNASLGPQLRQATRSIPMVLWKTTSADRGGRYPNKMKRLDRFMCALFDACLDLTSWTIPLSTSWYVDDAHFREPVYRKMAELLLQQLSLSDPNQSRLPWSELGLEENHVANLSRLPILNLRQNSELLLTKPGWMETGKRFESNVETNSSQSLWSQG